MQNINPKFIADKLKNINELFQKIDFVVKNELRNLEFEINALYGICRIPEVGRAWGLRKARIIRKLREYLADGTDLTDAIELTADDLGESVEFVSSLYNRLDYKQQIVDMNRYAKRYMIMHLARNGVKNVDIAKLTGYSKEYISMLKTGKKPVCRYFKYYRDIDTKNSKIVLYSS